MFELHFESYLGDRCTPGSGPPPPSATPLLQTNSSISPAWYYGRKMEDMAAGTNVARRRPDAVSVRVLVCSLSPLSFFRILFSLCFALQATHPCGISRLIAPLSARRSCNIFLLSPARPLLNSLPLKRTGNRFPREQKHQFAPRRMINSS